MRFSTASPDDINGFKTLLQQAVVAEPLVFFFSLTKSQDPTVSRADHTHQVCSILLPRLKECGIDIFDSQNQRILTVKGVPAAFEHMLTMPEFAASIAFIDEYSELKLLPESRFSSVEAH